jgi:hypothetical protein
MGLLNGFLKPGKGVRKEDVRSDFGFRRFFSYLVFFLCLLLSAFRCSLFFLPIQLQPDIIRFVIIGRPRKSILSDKSRLNRKDICPKFSRISKKIA